MINSLPAAFTARRCSSASPASLTTMSISDSSPSRASACCPNLDESTSSTRDLPLRVDLLIHSLIERIRPRHAAASPILFLPKPDHPAVRPPHQPRLLQRLHVPPHRRMRHAQLRGERIQIAYPA